MKTSSHMTAMAIFGLIGALTGCSGDSGSRPTVIRQAPATVSGGGNQAMVSSSTPTTSSPTSSMSQPPSMSQTPSGSSMSTPSSMSARSDPSMRPAHTPLTDANIIAILQAANEGEVEDGLLAQQRATNPDVRLYASRIAQEHKDMLEDGSNLASRMNITPSMPAFGTNMASEHDAMVQVLKAKSGDAFDRAYLEHEVQLHEDVMKRLDEVSIDARHPELKTYLTQARAAIQAHMKRAYDLQRSIMADTAPARGIRSDIR